MRLVARIDARARREDGVAAVEFAIVAMVFLVLLFGILTYGFIFGLDQSMNHAAEEGARAGISKADPDDAVTHAKTVVLDRLSWLGSNIQSGDVTASHAPCAYDAAVECLTVTVTYPWDTRPVIPKFPGLPTPTQMQAVAVIELT